MNLHVNGSLIEIESGQTIGSLLARYKLKPESVVVEYNLRVPHKSEYDSLELSEGDRIEILKFMGGG